MKILRLYLDTSTIGGCFDAEFARWSNELMDDFLRGKYLAILSDVTATEVADAPHDVRAMYDKLAGLGAQVLGIGQEALDLAKAYEARRILTPRFRSDMLHIALATVGNADVVVSWNFRHIVRLDKIRLFNAVNIELGYRALTICSPREVTGHGEEDIED